MVQIGVFNNMSYLIRLYFLYLIPALIVLSVSTIIFLLLSSVIPENDLYKVFYFIVFLIALFYLYLLRKKNYNPAFSGHVFSKEIDITSMGDIKGDFHEEAEERDASFIMILLEKLFKSFLETLDHTISAIFAIISIKCIHESLGFFLGHDAKLLDIIPYRYVFDLAHIAILGNLLVYWIKESYRQYK